MNIVIPMAGLGSRFRAAGYTTPKPLIPVLGKPMYAWAADSLPLSRCERLIFVLLSSQPEFPELRDDILARYARYNPVVATVPELTAGQAVTVLAAREWIAPEAPLLIHNADTAFVVDDHWADDARSCGAAGALLVFPSNEERWSFAREDDTGWVCEVREKIVISTWASTGAYWFRRGADFIKLSEARFGSAARESGEFYVSPLYNDLIAQGGKVKNYPIDRLLCFGTPEDLEQSLRTMEAEGIPSRHAVAP